MKNKLKYIALTLSSVMIFQNQTLDVKGQNKDHTISYEITDYPHTYSNTLDRQFKSGGNFYPKTGGIRDATRGEISQYLNPSNFIDFYPGTYTASKSGNNYYLKTIKITTNYVPLYKKSNSSSGVNGSTQKGDIFVVLDETSSWYKVRAGGKIGWVNKKFTTRTNGAPRDMYQFLILSGQSGMTAKQLNDELNGKGILEGLGQAFLDGSKAENINEIYLLSHALLETGNGESKLAKGIKVSEVNGKSVEPKVTYNMFGIGAYDWGPEKYGSERAYTEGWFTPEAAIIGGAHWIAKNYINSPTYKQDTLYKMRWNPSTPGTHQYAKDVAWAQKQTRNMNMFAELVDRYKNINLKFEIPTYRNLHSKIQWRKYGDEWYLVNREGVALTGWQERSKNWYYMKTNGIMQTNWQRSGGKWYYLANNGIMQTGWLKDKNLWYYLTSTGSMQTGWLQSRNRWYHFASNGVMNTGWTNSGRNWYYLNNSGVMQSGWLKDKNRWYYLTSNGSMQTGWLQNKNRWYHFASNGSMNTGWTKSGRSWYYLNNSGVMQSGWLKDKNKWYYLNTNGSMQTGWLQNKNRWYHFASNGAMNTGWTKTGGKWYYLNSNGSMANGWKKINGKWYYLNTNGAMETGWLKDKNKWYRFASNGVMLTGWRKVDNKWYYFNNSGVMQENTTIDGQKIDSTGVLIGQWKKIDNKWYFYEKDTKITGWKKIDNRWYYMDKTGVMLTGWQEIRGKMYFLNSNGSMATGWLTVNDKKYYLKDSGEMVTGEMKIGNKDYQFNSNGELIQ